MVGDEDGARGILFFKSLSGFWLLVLLYGRFILTIYFAKIQKKHSTGKYFYRRAPTVIDIDNKNALKGYRFIDLFAGIGGFRLALESLGGKCVYSNEWDKPAQETYCANFGDIPDGDITKVDEKDIPDHDILCAGFPCQAFSISGRQRGFQDSRGTLFFDVARIVKEKKPAIVFLENVKNFARHDNGNTLAVVKNTMLELGYSFFAEVLDASDYGVPQRRERIYMVCFRDDLCVSEFSFPPKSKKEVHIEDILEDESQVPDNFYVSREDTYIKNILDDTYSTKPIRLGTVNKGGQGERIYSTKGIGITLSAYGGGVFPKTGGYAVRGRFRRLTPRECARMMGFPDSYKLAERNTMAYKQFGNSVVVNVLQYIALEFSKRLSAWKAYQQKKNPDQRELSLDICKK